MDILLANPMRRTQCRIFSAIVVLLLLAAGREAWAKDEVRIFALTPQTRAPLRVGDSVSFEIGVEYDVLSPENRALIVSVVRGGHGEHTEVLSRWTQVIHGRDRVTLQRSVSIPATNNISIEVQMEEQISRPREGRRILADDRKEFDVVDRTGSRIKAGGDGDIVTIVSISPAEGARIRSGETTRFDLKVDYELKSAATGRVSWGVTSGADIQAGFNEPIRKGKGSLNLSREVQMHPGMGANPRVYVTIFADGYARRVATDVADYSMDVPQQSSADSLTQLQIDVAGKFQDRIKIVQISPVRELKLKSGTPVGLEFRIDYELVSLEDAELAVQFWDRTWFGEDMRVVHQGKGSFTVTRTVLPLKDSGPELSVNAILGIPVVGKDKLTFSISPD